MLKRLFIYLFSGLLMVSCYTFKKPEKPKNLISKKKMVNIIIDLKLLSSSNGSNKQILDKLGIYSEDYVFKKYNIDSVTFASSNNYYAFYLEEYDEIYEKVQDSLEGLSGYYRQLETQEREEKRKQDSINTLRKKDSLNMLKLKDTIKIKALKDSISKLKIKNKPKPKLIEPVSDKVVQSQ
tara:strand:+ start:7644 stop:8186 length:543 start_codon:yes stop_codon:yes gene_type:complete